MTEIKNQTLQTFFDELASKAPTPGGGGAAAVMGVQSAALTSMVCNLTIGKPKYAEVERDMIDLLEKSEALRAEMTTMIAADVDVFNRLMAAYGLPKDNDSEKTERSAAIQEALKAATQVPLNCARASREAIGLSRIAAEKGNIGVISDAGVAALAGYAALKSAALNVYINVGSIKDRDFADAKVIELESLLAGSEAETEMIYAIVRQKLS